MAMTKEFTVEVRADRFYRLGFRIDKLISILVIMEIHQIVLIVFGL